MMNSMPKTKVIKLTDKKYWEEGVKFLRKNDPKLARVMSKDYYRKMKLDTDYYGAIIESIIFQQLAGKAAEAILKRFKGLYKGRIPKPEEFLSTAEHVVRSAGISPQKYSYVSDLCKRLDSGILELESLRNEPDDKVVEKLSKVRGIGRWTAEMFLIFSLGRTDVMPVDDLGVRKGIQKAYNLRNLPDKKKIFALSKKWHPYCSIVTLYMWNYLDMVTVGDAN